MRPPQRTVAGRQEAVARKLKAESRPPLSAVYRLLSTVSCLLPTAFCLLFFSGCAYLHTPPFEGQVLNQEWGLPLTTARVNLACVAEKPTGGLFALENHWTVSDGEGNFMLASLDDFYWDPFVFSRLKEIRLLVYAPNYQFRELSFPAEEARHGGLLDPFKPFKVDVNLASLSQADEKAFAEELRRMRDIIETSREKLYLADPDFLNQAEYEFIRRFPQSREAQLSYLTIAKRTYHKRKDPAAAIRVYQEYLDKYPEGFLRREVQDEVRRLRAKLPAPTR